LFIDPLMRIGPGRFKLVLFPQMGPFRSLPGTLAYPTQDPHPPFSTCYTRIDASQEPPATVHRGFEYYFREDYLLWQQQLGSVRVPGMNWWAKRLWEGQRFTVEGRVFTA
jgi:hypothetical protein